MRSRNHSFRLCWGLLLLLLTKTSWAFAPKRTLLATVVDEFALSCIPALDTTKGARKNSNDSSTFLQASCTKKEAQSAKRSTIARHLPYASAFAALCAYHSVHGHLVMPWHFVVSNTTTAFPTEWIGYDLAVTVYHMDWWQQHVRNRPHRVNGLNRLGFVWQRLQPKWNIVMEALVTYHSIHGHIRVPDTFVIPTHNTTWPKATWQIPLGKTVSRIRQRNDFLANPTRGPERRQQLERMGFVWSCPDQAYWTFYLALRQYRNLYSPLQHQPLCVPTHYVVPHNDTDWPEEFWGYPLGLRCRNVMHYNLYNIQQDPVRRQYVQGLGLLPATHRDWLVLSHAAALYSRLHQKTLDVPRSFVVPANSEDWPPALEGLALGERLHDIRSKGYYITGRPERRRQLEALGFQFRKNNTSTTPAQDKKFHLYCEAVKWYKRVFGNETDIPVRFIIPAEDPWPSELWNYSLGSKTNQIRVRELFVKNRPERREKLVSLGVRFEKLRFWKRLRNNATRESSQENS